MTKKNFSRIAISSLFMVSFSLTAYADNACQALGGIVTGPRLTTTGSVVVYPVTVIAAPQQMDAFIGLADYANVITAALNDADTPLPLGENGSETEISIPACASLSSQPDAFTPISGRVRVGFGLFGESWSYNPNYYALTNSQVPGVTLGAAIKYCNCNDPGCTNPFSFGGNTNLTPNAPYGAEYNSLEPTGSGTRLAVCGTNLIETQTGSLVLKIYAPPGIIPPIGNYTTSLSLAIGPPP